MVADGLTHLSMGTMLNYLTKLYQLGALPVIRPGVTQSLAIGPASAASGALGAGVVRLVATSDCHVAIGRPAAPADGGSLFLPADVPEYFACLADDNLTVIQHVAAGTLYITGAQ